MYLSLEKMWMPRIWKAIYWETVRMNMCIYEDHYLWSKAQAVLLVKNPFANATDIRDPGLISGSGRSPGGGHGNLLQYFCLENSMDRGTWWATVHGVAESDMTDLVIWCTCAHTSHTFGVNIKKTTVFLNPSNFSDSFKLQYNSFLLLPTSTCPGRKVSWGLFFLTKALLFGIIISKHFKSCPSYRNPSIREHSYLRKLVLDTHSGDLGDQL